MIEVPFASLANRFSGLPGWVVGRGPTRFRYEQLAEVEGPVFFINDAVSQERWLKEGHPAFFFAHDGVMECWLRQEGPRSIPVLIVDQPMTGPPEARREGLVSGADDSRLAKLGRAIFYRKAGPWEQASILSRSREEIQRSGQLYVSSGTIHPLLHFAWYVGCSKLHLVGCDGLPGIGYDERLENRSHSKQQAAMTIRVQQEKMLRHLSLPHDYLGTIPHHLEMSVKIRLTREGQAKLPPWVESLLSLYRSFGCGNLARHDFLDRADTYWIKGRWLNIEACVECLLSPEYREIRRSALEPLFAASNDNLKIAYQAVPS
jgi:hypothetical protein